MRDKADWDKRVRPNFLKRFPQRIQRDIEKIQTIPDVPKEIESCYIHGDTETGKTMLAVFMMLQEAENLYISLDSGKICAFVSTTNLINEIKETFNKNYEGRTEQDIIRHYSGVHLLVLDDFGTVKTTDWVYQTLYSIINNRYEELKKTIITSNLSLPELATFLGDTRITSRIDRMGDNIQKLGYKK